MSRGRGGGRIRRPRQRQPEMSSAARRVLTGLGFAGGVLLFLVGLGLMGFVLPVAGVAVEEGDLGFFVGAAIIVLLAIAAVAVAGPSLVRGLVFHFAGVLGPYALGMAFEPFELLRVSGGVIYLTAWCWVFLGDIVVRLVRSRWASPA